MTDLAAGDVTYTVVSRESDGSGAYRNYVTIAFGNGSLTYPSGGVPLTKASMACPNAIKDFQIIEKNLAANGYDVDYDKSTNKLLMYKYDYSSGTDAGAITLVATTDAPSATSIEAVVTGW